MSELTQILLADARESLLKRVASSRQEAETKERVVERSLCFWLEIDRLVGETASLDAFFGDVMKATSQQDNRPIAALGLGLSFYRTQGKALLPAMEQTFVDRLRWQIGCTPRMNGQLQPFCLDSLALFGLTLGAVGFDETLKTELARWLGEFLEESYSRRNIMGWERAILSSISQLLPLEIVLAMPNGSNCSETRLVLARRTALKTVAQVSDAHALLQTLKTGEDNTQGFGPTAFRLSALEVISQESPVSGPATWTIERVVELLRRFPRALERWTWEDTPMTSKQGAQARQWHIDHEYHVQNLLWGVLGPIFPDMEDEFYTEPIGQKHPRADLGLPSLGLVIEAKFLRASDKPQKVIEEIAADVSFYRAQGSKWQHIIPFIWDEGRRSEAHDTIEQGLAKLDGIAGTVIISRPGKMVDAIPTSTVATPQPSTPSAPATSSV